MDCNSSESSECNSLFGPTKSCYAMSKLKDSSPGSPPMIEQSQRIAPIIRIVHIIPPKVVKTDPANFSAVVQKLTGKHSGHLSRQSFKKSKQRKMTPIMSPRRSKYTNMSYAGQDEFPANHFCSKQPPHKKSLNYEDQFKATFAQVKSESVEDSLTWCDNFSGLFDGCDELDIFASQMDSGSMLPEFFTIDPPVADRISTASFSEELRETVCCD